MADLSDVVSTILESDDATFALIQKAVETRRKTGRDNKALTNLTNIYVGDRVKLVSISPQYLQGEVGVITSIDVSSKFPFTVTLDNITKRGKVLNVAAVCVEKLP